MNHESNNSKHLIHDLRAPIAILSSLAKTHSHNLPKDIRDSLNSCTKYLEDIMALYFGLPTKSESCSNSISNIVFEKMALFQNEEVSFNTELQSQIDDLALLSIDTLSFNRLLFNLIDNAIAEFKVNEVPNPQISITSYNNENYFFLSLSDNGCGFPPELLEGSSDLPIARGLGIGLNCVKSIIKESGGEVLLSNGPSGGAQILLQIPLTSLSNKTIVLYEDEPLFIELWKNSFKHSAIELIINPEYLPLEDNIVFIDVNLKGRCGLKLAKELYLRGLKNLFLTTSHEPEQFKNLTYIKGIIGKEPPLMAA